LRTKKGDILLVPDVGDGGVYSDPVVCFVGPGGSCSKDPLGSVSVCPILKGGVSLPLPVGSQATLLTSTDRCIRGRVKKATKKSNPYLPGNKFFKLQGALKGGAKSKRKMARVGAANVNQVSSENSDPVKDSGLVGDGGQRHHFYDPEGISLEVVLSQQGECDDSPIGSTIQCSITGAGGAGGSGLGDYLGRQRMSGMAGLVTGTMVDKDRGDAQHIIDIQEDLGMTFKGQGDEDVRRCMRSEERDRQKKNDWVQGDGH
jgi:hypothetical protein